MKIIHHMPGSILLASLSACSFNVAALEPAPIGIGYVDLVPTLQTDLTSTDNMLLAADDAQSSEIVVITPKLEATLTDGFDLYTAHLEIQHGNYSATREDDYTDWRIGAGAYLELDVRSILDLNAEFSNTHERRGTGFSQGNFFTPVPDKFNTRTVAASYQYGTTESTGRIVIDASHYDKIYTNNAPATNERNRVDQGWGSTFYLGVLPSTDILFQYRRKKVDYANDPVAVTGVEDSLDSVETYAYVGATWQATASTTGMVKLGYGSKVFIDPDRKSSSGPSWEAELRWAPLSYSIFTLGAGRQFGEPSGIGSGLDTRRYSLSWQHNWNGQWTSTIATDVADDSYLNSARHDRVRGVRASLDYSFDTWLDLYVAAELNQRSSALEVFNYRQHIVRLGFTASL